MTVYENGDDEGNAKNPASKINGSACKEIACCNIRRIRIAWPIQETIEDSLYDNITYEEIREENK